MVEGHDMNIGTSMQESNHVDHDEEQREMIKQIKGAIESLQELSLKAIAASKTEVTVTKESS